MPNDAKLGLVVGVGLVLGVAVAFFRKTPASPPPSPEPAAIAKAVNPGRTATPVTVQAQQTQAPSVATSVLPARLSPAPIVITSSPGEPPALAPAATTLPAFDPLLPSMTRPAAMPVSLPTSPPCAN